MEQTNQVEELKKLYAMDKEYLIPRIPKEGQLQARVIIKPLEIDEMGLIDPKDESPEALVANTKKLLARCCGVSEEHIRHISFEYLKELMEAVIDANNFTKEDIEKVGVPKLLERIKKGQDERSATKT